jgi:hypothetical protein
METDIPGDGGLNLEIYVIFMNKLLQRSMNEHLSSFILLYSLIEFVILVLFCGSESSALLRPSKQFHNDFQYFYYLGPVFILKVLILVRVKYYKLPRLSYTYISVTFSILYLIVLFCDLTRLHHLENLK